jgi:DNA polymerase gamma 1
MKLNPIGYPVISDQTFSKVFGEFTKRSIPTSTGKTRKLLQANNIPFPVDYPENLFDGELPFPDLRASTLDQHFEKIAEDFVGQYLQDAELLATCKIPPTPPIEELVPEVGWTRYTFEDETWTKEPVPYPLESGVFDTETFVEGGAFPVIGTALTHKAAYIWLASEFVNPDLPVEQWDQFGLIPLGTNKFIIGHNISYDRVRVQEAYNLTNNLPENFYFDTLSAHIGVSGLASGQRWLYVLAAKDPDSLTEQEKRQLRYSPKWASEGSTNSLIETYNFHVAAPKELFQDGEFRLKESDKEVRDLFVKAKTMKELANPSDFYKLIDYAIKDVFYTFELYQALWPKYRESTPSTVALAGHYFLAGSKIPLVDNWESWIDKTEEVFQAQMEEMDQICKDLMKTYVEEWGKELDKDLLQISYRFEEEPEKLVEEVGLQKKKTVKLTDVLKALDKLEIEWRFNSKQWAEQDPWLKQLDWAPQNYTGKFAFMPKWACKFLAEPDKNKFSVKNRAAHLLLKLKWEEKPILWVDGQGWCFEAEDEVDE